MPRKRFQPKPDAFGIHSPDFMRMVIDRERCRCDRYSESFALVVFPVDKRNVSNAAVKRLIEAIQSRKRITDEIGWTGKYDIGALLPQTTIAGAKKFADDMIGAIGEYIEHPACQIHLYPVPMDISFPVEAGESAPEMYAVAPLESIPESESRGIAQKNNGDGSVPEPTAVPANQEETGIEGLLVVPPPIWKRMLDITGSLLGLIFLSPVLLMIALFIKIVSPGPVFFRQERVGYMGKTFMCFKFRTMHPHVEESTHRNYFASLIQSDVQMTKLDGAADPRIIPLGKILRLTGLDEIPQLINVLRGEMSLVGPRPCIPYEYCHYQPWQKQRVEAVPGLTGLWQVNGKNRTTFKEMMRFDINYARHKSPGLDFKIIFKTPLAIIKQVTEKSE